MTSKNLTVSPPPSIFHKHIKFDLRPLFKGVAKAITHATTLKFEELGNDAAEMASGLGLKTTPEELSFLLIKRALYDAFLTLSTESISHFQNELANGNVWSSALDISLSNVTISLDKTFLDSPSKQPFLAEIVNLYSQWLVDAGIAPRSADIISQRLPSYFVFSLTGEWRKNASTYKPLIDALKTPFTEAAEREWDWATYFALLNRRIQENIFDEPFSLSQIYVPLNAHYLETEGKDTGRLKFRKSEKRKVISLESELTQWLKKGKSDDAIRVISGGPGSGKSTFAKIFSADIAEKQIAKPIYIPLHLIDPTRDVNEEVAKFVRDEGYLRFNPLDQDHKESKLLLVFDGLDELANQGKIAAQVTKDFVQAVEKMVERRNLGPYPIRVLLSGREVVVQENQTEFRKPKQILTVLPYFTPAHEHDEYDDPNSLLKNDARNDWWRKYGILSGHGFTKLPENLKRHEIDEITAQPLLNYLVALSFTRGKLDFEKELNLTSIYSDLITAVYERGYEKGRTYRPIKHITCKEFIRVLEEIGLAAWHGSDGRSTSVDEILLHCRESGLAKLVESFQEGAKAGVTKLLAAFFFRKSGEHASGDPTFVFTHKSFGEYLTASRLVRGVETIVMQLARRKVNPDDGFDAVVALTHWTKLTGPAQLTAYIHRFLKEEIRHRPNKQLGQWQEHLTELLNHAIERGMPVEKLGALSHFDASRQSANASEALVLVLNACAIVTNKIVKPEFSSEISFGSFLKRVCPQRHGPTSPILYAGLSYFDFSGQCLDMADLYGANLAYTVWTKSATNYVNFMMCDLRGANFKSAYISGSNFGNSNLEGANFSKAFAFDSRFVRANLSKANFSNAKLRSADMNHANLDETVFTNASIPYLRISSGHKATIDFTRAKDFEKIRVEERVAEENDELEPIEVEHEPDDA